MVDTLIEDFDEEECINFALSLQDKAYNQALQSGLSSEEAQKIGQNKYNEVCKRYCLEFIKKIEEKLASLSNQTVANLLRMLIALGLDIEDEEELEYWINRLTQESLNRVALYFNERDNISLYRQLISKPDTSKVLFNLQNYSLKEIEALSSIIKSLSLLNDKNTKNEVNRLQRKEILKKIEKILEKDIQLKIQQQRSNRQTRGRGRGQGRSGGGGGGGDPKDALISKMTSEGIESGGRYWNEVMSDYERSTNKNEFVKNWQIDNDRHNELDIKPINDKQREDERALAENEEHQRQEQEKQLRQQQEQEEIRQQEQLEIRKKQEEQAKQDEKEKQDRERDKIQEKRGIKDNSQTRARSDYKANQGRQSMRQMSSRGGR
ncbi:MAG: hypothetical protein E7004_00090 [Alphaproteobacteria bacterium]|nr:hypothetical protein [Alphaproteobacteria bacterium]